MKIKNVAAGFFAIALIDGALAQGTQPGVSQVGTGGAAQGQTKDMQMAENQLQACVLANLAADKANADAIAKARAGNKLADKQESELKKIEIAASKRAAETKKAGFSAVQCKAHGSESATQANLISAIAHMRP